MKVWGKRIGIALATLVVVLALAVGGAYAASVSRQGEVYDVAGATFEIPNDPESLAEGERLYVTRGCAVSECHTEDAGGATMMEDGPFGTITAANLTAATAEYSSADWDRAVRHGIRRDGTSLVFMQSIDFIGMSDRELGLIAAYVRSRPRVERSLPPIRLSVLARIVDLAGVFVLFPASAIDHAAARGPAVPPGRTAEYGRELARLCMGCHGRQLSGGPIPGAPPELGTPLNLTPHESGLASWSEEQFRTLLRTGVTPSGHRIDPVQMPWPAIGRMTDDEIGALWLFLATLPPLPEGSR